MQIEQIEGRYRIIHEEVYFEIPELISHVRANGHLAEPVGFVARDMKDYQRRSEIAREIELEFTRKFRKRA